MRMIDRSPGPSRRGVFLGTALLLLGACGRAGNRSEAVPEVTPDAVGPAVGTLEWAVGGEWRAADHPRDRWLHPIETLRFFGLRPGIEVVQVWPGRGLWTEILAPYLAKNGGSLYAANFQLGANPNPAEAQIVERFKQRFGEAGGRYGGVHMTEFGPTSGPVAPANSADLVLFMQNLHEWMAAGLADKAFRDAFAALKPGGILGVVQHRANIGGLQDPTAANGYVQEPYVKRLAADAGLTYVSSSEVNANPKDTKDHPFGVWTLPPDRLSAPRDAPPDPDFNHAKYDLIGESDRMTLKFRKPA
jgi:predicted methyltransferase